MKKLLLFAITFFCWLSHSYAYDPLCGPNSLMAICEYNNIETTIEELCELSDYKDISGTSMLGLCKAAIEKNLPAVPLKLKFEDLLQLKQPAILFIYDNHFTVFYGAKGDKVIIQDYPQAPKKVKKEILLKKWQGESLIFSEKLFGKYKNKIIKEIKSAELKIINAPVIDFSEYEYNFGEVEQGKKISHSFSFTNNGKKPLEIATRTSCSCITAKLEKNVISCGEKSELTIEYNTKGDKGKKNYSVFVKSNDPQKSYVRLQIEAFIKN